MSSGWTIRNIYLYLVCLITLVILIFSVVDVVKNVVELLYPEPNQVMMPVPPLSTKDTLDEVQLERDQKQQQELQRQWNLRRTVVNLVRSGALLLVAGPLYIYHWRRIERT